MLLKTRLEKSIALRSIAILCLMSLATMLFMQHKATVFAGLLIGSLLSHVRFHTLVMSFSAVLSGKAGSPVLGACLWYFIGLVMLVLVFVLALLHSLDLFLGVAAGILLVPLTITLFGMFGKLRSDISALD